MRYLHSLTLFLPVKISLSHWKPYHAFIFFIVLSNVSFLFQTGQLNNADVTFPPSTTQEVVHIIGIENRTVYADVTVSAGATSSDEEDYVEIECLKNFVDKRKEQ